MKTLADRIEENMSGSVELLADIRGWQQDDAGRSELVETLLGEAAEMLEAPRSSALEVYALVTIAVDHDPLDQRLSRIYGRAKDLADAATRVAWEAVERDIGEAVNS